MRKFNLKLMLVLSLVMCLFASVPVCAAEADGGEVLAETTDGWVENSDGSWSYYVDGAMVYDQVYYIGGFYYAFDSYGKMVTNDMIYCYNPYFDNSCNHYAKADGTLYVNSWYEYKDEYGDCYWYYFGKYGNGVTGLQNIGGTTYFFWYDGYMAEDTIIYDYQKERSYRITDSGVAVELKANGWTQVGKDWFYCVDGDFYSGDIYKIGNSYYGFDYDGTMWADCTFWHYDQETYEDALYAAKADGALYMNAWYFDERVDDWYYLGADCKAVGGLQTIGGKQYYFGESSFDMYENCYVDAGDKWLICDESGVCTPLANNVWTSLNGDWYYVLNGEMCIGGIYEIGGKKYSFDGEGVLNTNTMYFEYTDEGEVCYYADANGVLVANQWVYVNEYSYMEPDWYYFGADSARVKGKIDIGGKTYILAPYMATDETWYVDGAWYLVDESGVVVTGKTGWYMQSGKWYYIYKDGSLYEGVLSLGGTKYYMVPEMVCNSDYIIIDDVLYQAKDTTGALTAITKDGWYQDSYSSYYVKNGKVYTGWVQSGNTWYYVNPNMVTDDRVYEDGKMYEFDKDGKMYANTWIHISDGYMYATASGALATGEYKIGGVTYNFNDYGYLMQGTEDEGTTLTVYTTSGTETVKLSPGWNQVKSKWYYVVDNHIVTGTLNIGNNTFRFDAYGAMYTDCIVSNSYYDKNGALVKDGWISYNGHWMYAEDGRLYSYGIYEIGGVEYFFSEYYMATSDVDSGDRIIRINSNGAIKSWDPVNQNGWNNIAGEAYYYKNGERYTGWVGDSYFDNGYKVYEGSIYDSNSQAYYYMEDGKCVYNAWCGWGDMCFAQANGKLVDKGWLNKGGTWYYFEDCYAVTGARCIDGVNYYFDRYGRLVKTFTSLSNGWYSVDGNWLYARDGRFVREETIYVGGYWYYMDYEGVMKTYGNRNKDGRLICSSWVYEDDKWYYYGADGDNVNGWHKIAGVWYYFDGAMVTGCFLIEDKLYKFADSGAYIGEVNMNTGWYKDGSEYYYFENGEVVKGQIKTIGGIMYGFGRDGVMMANQATNTYLGVYYFGANGARVTKSGTYTDADGGTIYVDSRGMAHTGYTYVNNSIVYMTGYTWDWLNIGQVKY